MARKGWRKLIAEAIAIHYYRWEFLRRNEGYRQSYRELWRKHGKLLRRIRYPNYFYQHDPAVIDVRYLSPDELFPLSHRDVWWDIYGRNGLSCIIANHCKKWDVSFMKDPGPLTKPQMLLEHLQKSWSINVPMSASGKLRRDDKLLLNPFWQKAPPPSAIELNEADKKSVEAARSAEWFFLGLNLHSPKKEVLARVEQWYDEVVVRGQKETRARLNDYPTYLRIWDLMSKQKSVHEVALALGEYQKLNKKQRVWVSFYRYRSALGDDDNKARTMADQKSGIRDGSDALRAIHTRIDYGFNEANRMITQGWRDLSAPCPLVWQ